MAFSPNGSRLCCGFENAIEIFDVSQPGAEGYRLHTTPTRSSRQGQKGIISSLAFSFVDSYSDSILAAGSFSGSIGLYDISGPVPLTTLLQPSQTGGITKDGNLSIFSAQPLPDQLEPVTTFSLSSEPISTTLFHPFAPLLVTTSGARKFGGAPRTQRDSVDSIGCDSSEDDDGTDADVQEGGLDVEERNSLELWRLS
ncbi:hypothetical protein JCM10295v2_002342 [Rhodotorula toruloides]